MSRLHGHCCSQDQSGAVVQLVQFGRPVQWAAGLAFGYTVARWCGVAESD